MKNNKANFLENIPVFISIVKDYFADVFSKLVGKPEIKNAENDLNNSIGINKQKPSFAERKAKSEQDILYEDLKSKLLFATYNNEDNTQELFPILDKLKGDHYQEAFRLAIRNQSIGICAYFLNNEDDRNNEILSEQKHFAEYLKLCILYNSEKILKYFLQDERFKNTLEDVDITISLLKICYREGKEKEKLLHTLLENNHNCYLITEIINNSSEGVNSLYDTQMIKEVIFKGRYEELDKSLAKKEKTKPTKKNKI